MAALPIDLHAQLRLSPIPHQCIKEVVIKSASELIVGLAIAILAASFMPAGAFLFIATETVTTVALNTALRCLSIFNGYLTEQILLQMTPHSQSEALCLILHKAIKPLFSFLSFCSYWSSIDPYRERVLHELGHFTLFKLLCKGSAAIQITRRGGNTLFKYQGLSPLGHLFGKKISWIIIASAGVAFTTLFATGCIVIAHFYQNSHPEFSLYLYGIAIFSTAQSSLYVLSAYFIKTKAHDFAYLRSSKISAFIPLIAILTPPLLAKIRLIINDLQFNVIN